MKTIHSLKNILLAILLTVAGNLAFSQIQWDNPQAGASPIPKQLAGPPSDFLNGVMKVAEPGEVGIRSKSAMLPVHLEQGKNGRWYWQGEVAVENGAHVKMMVFSGEGDQWELSLRMPGMKRAVSIDERFSEYREDAFGIGENTYSGSFYTFDQAKEGTWTVAAVANGPRLGANAGEPDGFILISDTGSYRLFSHLTTRALLVGGRIGIVAFGYDRDIYGAGATPFADATLVREASLRLTTPAGEIRTLPMFDDGLHNDGGAGDGVFGALFVPAEIGEYQAQVIARGATPAGKSYLRTAEHVLPVIAPGLTLEGDVARTGIVDDNRMTVQVPVGVFTYAPEKYRAFAEVWGVSDRGETIPVCWIGGMVTTDNGFLALGLDSRWIAMAGARTPFELRNLRIEDVDVHVPVATSERLALQVDRLPAGATRTVSQINQEMLMGVRPRETASRAGARLLLVHGYCSGNVWGSVSGQFSSASVFQDFNRNRSHDAFAIQIWNFGNSYDSYGIVAHSQGGAASLHLYTYYWSGLDDAGAGRLIQSVGTPYQGTALAGNLAALGAIFGVGCGSNTDLTYSGASSWLSGIPSWARSKVNYYTTSFDDVWWRYDYCHLASDLVLDDPDDGTTEKAYGQLSGAVNRGHKEDWCHTTGMRDPAHYQDSGRNGTMNANAAR